jgi:putative tricarboxylic transport membrane protein
VKKPHIRSLGEGIALVLIGAAVLLLIPSQIDTVSVMRTQMSPAFLPVVLGVALSLVGLGLVIQAFRIRSVQQAQVGPAFSRHAFLRVALAAVLLVVYTLLFPRLGFVVTSGLFMGIFIYIFGLRSIFKIGLSMVLVPLGVWLFFEKLFRIPLPHGLLF